MKYLLFALWTSAISNYNEHSFLAGTLYEIEQIGKGLNFQFVLSIISLFTEDPWMRNVQIVRTQAGERSNIPLTRVSGFYSMVFQFLPGIRTSQAG